MYSIQLPLPKEASCIYIGALLSGSGRLWVDNFQVLIDGKDISLAKQKPATASLNKDRNNPQPITRYGKIPPPTKFVLNDSTSKISIVPEVFGFNAFYKKYLNVKGIPIVTSEKVPDVALYQARAIILQMLEKIPEKVRFKIIENNVRVAIMAKDELTTDIPEHSNLDKQYWDDRARGLGATFNAPATSCAEENLLCYPMDRYKGEDIFIHEFAHTIHTMGISQIEKDFDERLLKVYENARSSGLWKKTYAITNPVEYFGEGVQSWFNVNKESGSADGVHNQINTRAELKWYDPELHALIKKYFADSDKKISCQLSE